jgi:hypothetical protein
MWNFGESQLQLDVIPPLNQATPQATPVLFDMSHSIQHGGPQPPPHLPPARWPNQYINHVEARYFQRAKEGVERLFGIMQLRQGNSVSLMGERSEILEQTSMAAYHSKARCVL